MTGGVQLGPPRVISAIDGYPLGARVVRPEEPSDSVVIINPAVGVEQKLYSAFAEHLAAQGHTVVTYDYRGVGESRPNRLRGFQADMLDWGRLDFAGVLRFVLQTMKPARVSVIGHSAGGALIGLTPECERIDRVIAVATPLGYWRLWPGPRALFMLSLSYLVMPGLCRLFGYLPARRLGWGADLPASLACAWARWIRRPDFFFSLPRLGPTWYDAMRAPILWLSFEDDAFFAPRAAVDACTGRYPNAEITRRHITPAEVRLPRLGHSGIFRRRSAASLWPALVSWLDAD